MQVWIRLQAMVPETRGVAEEVEGIIDNSLLPNWPSIVSHVLATLIILAILYYYLWKPFLKFVGARQAAINAEIEASQKLQRDADLDRQRARLEISTAASAAEKTLEDARQEGINVYETLKNDALKYAQKVREDSQIELQQAEAQLRQKISKEIAHNTTLAAETLLKKHMNDQLRNKLNEDALAILNDLDLGDN